MNQLVVLLALFGEKLLQIWIRILSVVALFNKFVIVTLVWFLGTALGGYQQQQVVAQPAAYAHAQPAYAAPAAAYAQVSLNTIGPAQG